MKRVVVAFLWLVLILPTILQCEEATVFFPEEVYVVGLGAKEGKCGGAIWKNRESPQFTDLDNCNKLLELKTAGGFGVATQNGVLLVAGQSLGGPDIVRTNHATLWRDGVKELLTNWNAGSFLPGASVARGMSVSGNDIYITGTTSAQLVIWGPYLSLPVLWKNGIPDTLRRIWPQGTGPNYPYPFPYEPTAVYSDENNVVATGIRWSYGYDKSRAVYWVNGEPTIADSLEGFRYNTPYDVIMINNDVYVVGIIHEDPYTYTDGPYKAALWKNGDLQTLADNGVARGIAIQGDNIFVVGSVGQRPVYWLNGEPRELSTQDDTGAALAIFIRGSDVFIVGGSNAQSGYWRNGMFYKLSNVMIARDIVAKAY